MAPKHGKRVKSGKPRSTQPSMASNNADSRPLKLPAEIFDRVLSFSSTAELWRLRSVSRTWRESIEGNKLLWRSINFGDFKWPIPKRLVEQLQHFSAKGCRELLFERSAWKRSARHDEVFRHPVWDACPLFPGLQALSASEITFSPTLADRVAHTSNLKKLTLELGGPATEYATNYPDQALAARTNLREILPKFPDLEALVLQNTGVFGWAPITPIEDWARHGMWPAAAGLPSLKIVSIRNDFMKGRSKWMHLHASLEGLSAAAPNLEVLHVQNLRYADFPDFPKLRELTLEDVGVHYLPFSLPKSLEKLRIDCCKRPRADQIVCTQYAEIDQYLPYLPHLKELSTNLEVWAGKVRDGHVYDRYLYLWSQVFAKSQCQPEVLRIRQPISKLFAFSGTNKDCDLWLRDCLLKHPHLFANLKTLEVEIHTGRDATCDDELGLALAKACPRLTLLSWNGPWTLSQSTIAVLRANPNKEIKIIHISWNGRRIYE